MDSSNAPIVLGHYRLGKTLGIGAFGKVKLAHHIITGQKVAVKILNKGKIKHMEMAEKVRREINILNICTHPHIIRLYEVIDTPSDIFVIMEYVSGGELFDYIVSRGRLSPDEARQFFHQIISSIEYCHFHKIIHRDLKPENLLLDADNNIKLADFGLSNISYDGDFLRTSCGSPNYAAPEVISGNLYAGPEVDVWSCGVILYALLCGTLPFDDESIPNLFKKIKSGMYSLPSHLSQSSRDLILRMLVVDPMKRIPIAEVRQHPWFQHKLPAYLSLPPEMIEMQEKHVDEEIVQKVCSLVINKVSPTADAVIAAVQSSNTDRRSLLRHELKVAYQLLLDAKRHKLRIADVVLALQDASQTPPTGSMPKVLGLGSSMSAASPMGTSAAVQAALTGGTQEAAKNIGSGRPPVSMSSTAPPASTMEQRETAAKRRRWYLGIQSKKDPAHVMNEVYKAMQALRCRWYQVNSYRVLCLWQPEPVQSSKRTSMERLSFDFNSSPYNSMPQPTRSVYMGGPDPESGDGMDMAESQFVMDDILDTHGDGKQDSSLNGLTSGGVTEEPLKPAVSRSQNAPVKIALSLYKVQQSIYLLDFQRVEGDAFGYMKLCAMIVTELKNLSAASRAAAAAAGAGSSSNQVATQPPQPPQQQQQQQQQAMGVPRQPTGPPLPQFQGVPTPPPPPHPVYSSSSIPAVAPYSSSVPIPSSGFGGRMGGVGGPVAR